jgi:phosphate transport system substrate-binding protein
VAGAFSSWEDLLPYNGMSMPSARFEGRKRSLKAISSGLAIFIVLLAAGCRSKEKKAAEDEVLEGDVTISTSFALYPLMLKLSDEFHKVHPGLRFDVAAGGAAKSVSDTLNGLADLGGISREVQPQEKERGLWSAPVARDAVLAVVSEDNPHLQELVLKGAAKDVLARVWIAGNIRTWGDLVGEPSVAEPVHAYTRADLCGAGEIWAQFLGSRQEDLRGIGVPGESWMAGAIKKDPLGIGYTNLNFAYDARTLTPIQGLRILPIDFDANGRVDPEENFYSTRSEVLEAIASERYPSPPSRNLYIISRGVPERRSVREFLIWALADGQRLVPETGYIPLPNRVLEEALHSLTGR